MNDVLNQSNKNLEKLNEVKTQFFANVSHELRTPLMLILGPIEKIIHDKQLNDNQLQDIKLIQTNARILLKHVNDLLDIAKIDAQQMTLNYANVNLVQLADEIIQLFSKSIAKNN